MLRILRRSFVLLVAMGCSAPGSVSAGPIPFPEPRFGVVVERHQTVTMRDGARLSLDLYRPSGSIGRLPVILIRTPYNKDEYIEWSQVRHYQGRVAEAPETFTLSREDLGPLLVGDHLESRAVRGYRWMRYLAAYFFASHGYLVAVQDTRGRFRSEGAWLVQGNDIPDGYDTIDWLASRADTNGKIGMFGCSYRGDVQIFAAKSRHPNLKAIVPQASGSTMGGAFDRYHYFGIWRSGVLELANGAEWMVRNGPSKPVPLPPEVSLYELYKSLPVVEMLNRAGLPPTDWPNLTTRAPTDPWWHQFGYLNGHDRVDVPALFINSWWDFGAAETLDQFNLFRSNALSERTRDNQFMVMSPSGHCYSEMMSKDFDIGERDLGDPRLDYWRLYLDWFDHWLNGIDNGVTNRPKLSYYLMGANEWRSSEAWPIKSAMNRHYYLASGGSANGIEGNGRLLAEPTVRDGIDTFNYDPADPVPTEGGFFSSMDPRELPAGPYDQRLVESRPDVLVYTSSKLDRALDIVGPISVTLFVSSSAVDTDFTAKLVDVQPDGRALMLQEGIARARYREGFDREVFMRPGEVYELEIDLGSTATRLPLGHRLRLEISSSSFPRFARNLNTGADNNRTARWLVATNRVHYGAARASRLNLQVLAPEATAAQSQ